MDVKSRYRLRRNVRWLGVATGMALALIVVRNGWLIGGHDAPRAPVTRTPDVEHEAVRPPMPMSQTRSRIAAEDFPLVPVGPASVTKPLAPAPPPVVPESTTAPTADLPATSAAPVPSSTPDTRAKPDKEYVVQLGSYRREKNARQDQARYRALGLDARLSRSDRYFALRLPPFGTLEDAKRAEQEVRAHGIKPVVIIHGNGG